jgi:hypothetical protein
MAIQGLQIINVGLPNESANSDSLYTAFNKTKDNFTNLFANAGTVPVAGNGIAITTVSNVVTVTANLVAGNNVILSNSSGAIVISSLGGNSLSTITGVVAGTGLTGGGYFGNVTLGLSSSGVTSGTYTNPTVTIDSTGRITNASNNVIAGTVTSVGLTPGTGIQISGGPITSNGNITVTNTGVTRLTAGTGIAVSSSNGNITVSATTPVVPAAVTSVGISSSQLVVTNSPITSSGTITVNLPTTATFSGNLTAGNLIGPHANGNSNINIPATNGNVNISAVGNANIVVVTGTGANIAGTLNVTGNTVTFSRKLMLSGSEDLAAGAAANLLLTASYFTTSAAETATLAAGDEGQIKTFMMQADGGDMVITVTNAGWKTSGTGTITFDAIGDSCILQYISSKWFCIGNNGVVFA